MNIDQKAVVFLLLGASAIAFAPIFVRLSELGPSATALYRIFLSMPMLCIWMALDKKNSTKRPQYTYADYQLLILAGLFFAGDLCFWHWSIRLTSVANSTLLANFAPIFITLVGYFIFKEKFTLKFLFGMILAMSGVFLLLSESFVFQPNRLAGDFLGLVAAMFYAAYLMAVNRLRKKISTATVMTVSGIVSCICIVPVVIISEESFIASTFFGWGVLAGLALISHTGGQSLIAYALARLPAALGSVGLLLQPVLATIIAYLAFNESLGELQVIGGTIVIIGIYVARNGVR